MSVEPRIVTILYVRFFTVVSVAKMKKSWIEMFFYTFIEPAFIGNVHWKNIVQGSVRKTEKNLSIVEYWVGKITLNKKKT